MAGYKVSDTFPDKGAHASRPASPSTNPAFYSCTDHNKIYRWNGSVWSDWAVLGGGGSSAESYETALAALTGQVHRWKFDDASGATVADSVGSLPLTLSGTYTRGAASITGTGTTIGSSGRADSSGLGSLPVGDAARCIICVFRTTSSTNNQMTPFVYGATGTARNWFAVDLNTVPGVPIPNVNVATWSDDIASSSVPGSDADWHIVAAGYNGARTLFNYLDGQLVAKYLAGALATPSSGSFRVGMRADSTLQFLGDVDDLIVLNNWPGKRKLDRLVRALSA